MQRIDCGREVGPLGAADCNRLGDEPKDLSEDGGSREGTKWMASGYTWR